MKKILLSMLILGLLLVIGCSNNASQDSFNKIMDITNEYEDMMDECNDFIYGYGQCKLKFNTCLRNADKPNENDLRSFVEYEVELWDCIDERNLCESNLKR